MLRHSLGAGALKMTERDDDMLTIATERFERRVGEESGKLRVEMGNGFGSLEVKMADRNAELLKWLLVFWVLQTSALGTLMAYFK
jgi:hypothetical protein